MTIPFKDREHALAIRMKSLGICEQDFVEQFVHSSGPGGQNVNKVATCVLLTHKPSRLSVKCQRTRTQSLNRYWARVLLLDKIEKARQREIEGIRQQKAKSKRQNRKRPQWLKDGILEEKRRKSSRKQNRGQTPGHRVDPDS